MNSAVRVKIYEEPPFDYNQILRYAGCFDDDIMPLVEKCAEEISGKLSFRVCYTYLDEALLEKISENTYDLKQNLKNCSRGVLFAATVGLEPDRFIAKYIRTEPSKALIFQAIGTERVESLCNLFCKEIRDEAEQDGLYTRPRFSPGYGDYGIEAQRDIFKILDCPRKIGVTLGESLIMSPSKSVTAIIGISSVMDDCKSECKSCKKTNCEFRRC